MIGYNKPSVALQLARERILNDSNHEGPSYICKHLARIGGEGARLARARILERLAPNVSYGSWLQAHYPELYDRYQQGDRKVPRIQWIDAMIAEWQLENR